MKNNRRKKSKRTINGNNNEVILNTKEVINSTALNQLFGTQTNEGRITIKELPVDLLGSKLQSLPKDSPIALDDNYSIVVKILDDTKLRWVGHVDLSKIGELKGVSKSISAVKLTSWLETLMLELDKVAHSSEAPYVEFISEDEMNYSVVIECDNIRGAQDIMHNSNIIHIDAFRKAWPHNADRYGMGKLIK